MVIRYALATILAIGLTSFQAATQNPSQTSPSKPSPASPATKHAHAARNTGPQNTSADDLVKTTIKNELNAIANDHTHWMYQSVTRKDGGMVTEQVVETRDANVERVIARNGTPLTPDEQKQEDAKVQKFVGDTAAQHKQRQDLDGDLKKSKDMLSMLPDALTYTYAGTEGNKTKLTFKGNPGFHPPSREAKVFAAMEGQMLIDTKEDRLAQFSGHLARPVKFGGGLLGDLQQGGTFNVHQQEVGPHHWEITVMKVNIKGKALMFKTINEQQDETDTRFKRVSDDLTVAQAFDLAKKQPFTGSKPSPAKPAPGKKQ